MHSIATIVKGEADWAEFMFLLAAVLFAIVTVVHLAARAVESAMVSGGLWALALGLLLL